MSSTDLDLEVRAMLDGRRGDWSRVAKEAGVSHSWISKFVCGRIPNPGYATLRNLRRYLGGEQAAPAPQPEPTHAG